MRENSRFSNMASVKRKNNKTTSSRAEQTKKKKKQKRKREKKVASPFSSETLAQNETGRISGNAMEMEWNVCSNRAPYVFHTCVRESVWVCMCAPLLACIGGGVFMPRLFCAAKQAAKLYVCRVRAQARDRERGRTGEKEGALWEIINNLRDKKGGKLKCKRAVCLFHVYSMRIK